MRKIFLPVLIICSFVFTAFAQKNKPDALVIRIIIDCKAEKGARKKAFKECIGAGRANEGLRADWQQQLRQVQDEIGFRYIRFHGLLSDDMGIYREDAAGNPQYIFQYVDVLFDYLLSINLKPFVEFGFMPTDPIHDSYHSAAFILDKVKGTENHVNSLSYWVFTDIFEENGPRWTPFHGGFGMLNYQGIRKPSYFAFYFLGQLGDKELVSTDPASWACMDQNGNMQVLFWDFTLTGPEDSVNNQVYYKRDLPPKEKGYTELTISNLPEGRYYYQLFQTGYGVNDAYAAYYQMDSPEQLSKEQVSILKNETCGRPIRTDIIDIINGTCTKEFPVRENDVFLLKLDKVME